MGNVTLESPREEIVKAWVEALRSGEYKQATGYLHTDKGHCCLGVLCDVVGAIRSDAGMPLTDGEGVYFEYYEQGRVLPEAVRRAAGLASNDGALGDDADEMSLAEANDEGKPFSEIADLIESRPPGLFVED